MRGDGGGCLNCLVVMGHAPGKTVRSSRQPTKLCTPGLYNAFPLTRTENIPSIRDVLLIYMHVALPPASINQKFKLGFLNFSSCLERALTMNDVGSNSRAAVDLGQDA